MLWSTTRRKKTIEEGEVDLVGDLAEARLQHHTALAIGGLPKAVQVVDALAQFVDEEWGRFMVTWLDPVGEQVALFGLVPEVLVEVGVRDLLQGFNIITGDHVTVKIHELDAGLLECPLGE